MLPFYKQPNLFTYPFWFTFTTFYNKYKKKTLLGQVFRGLVYQHSYQSVSKHTPLSQALLLLLSFPLPFLLSMSPPPTSLTWVLFPQQVFITEWVTTMPGQILGEQDLQYGIQCYHHIEGAALHRLGLDICIVPLF